MPFGDLPGSSPQTIDQTSLVNIAGEVVKQWAQLYRSIPQSIIAELPFSDFYQQPCRKIIRTGAVAYPDFSAVTPFSFFQYICPEGNNCVITNINAGMNRLAAAEQVGSFLFYLNGYERPEYNYDATTSATALNLPFNLILKPTDTLEVRFLLATLGYAFPGDFAYVQLIGWEYPSKVGSE